MADSLAEARAAFQEAWDAAPVREKCPPPVGYKNTGNRYVGGPPLRVTHEPPAVHRWVAK
jgi:hypothetical protein